MTEDAKPPEAKKKVHPAVLIGPAIAIAAALFVVFSGSGKDDKGPPPEMGPDMGQVETTQPPAADTTQLAQAQVAPAKGAVATAPISFEDKTLTFSAVFPDAPAGDPAIIALRKDAESYLARKKQRLAPKLTA
jgi:hypothetical protein